MVVLTSFAPPNEGVRLQQQNTSAHVQGKDMGKGTLYIAESRLSWRSAEGQGFSLEYPAISLHAVSKDTTAFPHPCLYLMLDTDLDLHQNGDGGNSSDEEEGSGGVFEVRFVPENTSCLDDLYKVMSECQILHPDANDSNSEDEAEDFDAEEGYYEGEEGAELTPEGRATLARLEGLMDQGDEGIAGEEPQIGGLVAASGTPSQGAEPMEEQFDDAD